LLSVFCGSDLFTGVCVCVCVCFVLYIVFSYALLSYVHITSCQLAFRHRASSILGQVSLLSGERFLYI